MWLRCNKMSIPAPCSQWELISVAVGFPPAEPAFELHTLGSIPWKCVDSKAISFRFSWNVFLNVHHVSRTWWTIWLEMKCCRDNLHLSFHVSSVQLTSFQSTPPCLVHHRSPPFSAGSWAPASYFCKASSCTEAQKVRGGSGCPHGASRRLLIRLVVGRLQRRRGLGSCQQDRATPRRETGGKKGSWTFQTASFILGLAVAWLSGPISLVWEESCQGQRNPIFPLSWQRA